MKGMEILNCVETGPGTELKVRPVDSAKRLWVPITIYVYNCCISITLFHQQVFTSITMAMDQPSNVTRYFNAPLGHWCRP